MVVHFTPAYLLNPQHKITINLIGVGGTGSQVLTCLARLDQALMGIGHPGLHVRAFDPDTVTFANLGRQLFSESDLHLNKAVVLISRVNRFFFTNWEAHPHEFSNALFIKTNDDRGSVHANITITCVDTASARLEIGKLLQAKITEPVHQPGTRRMYWLDFGNGQKTGQVVLGTLQPQKQPDSKHVTNDTLPIVTKLFNLKKVKDEDSGPSCSLAEAITKQDLFVNSTLAQFGVNILWKMFREGCLKYNGCYLNLDTLSVNPIPIK